MEQPQRELLLAAQHALGERLEGEGGVGRRGEEERQEAAAEGEYKKRTLHFITWNYLGYCRLSNVRVKNWHAFLSYFSHL